MRLIKISTPERNIPLIDVQVENNLIISIPVINELFTLFLSKKGDDRNLIIANFHFLARLEELFKARNTHGTRIKFVLYHMKLVADSWKLKLEEF